MNSRERVAMAVAHEEPDHAPCDDSLWVDTKARFLSEGMPEDVPDADYFGFDIVHVYLDASPRLPERIIGVTDEQETYVSKHGYSCTAWRKKSGALQYFDHVSATSEGWKKVKEGFALDAGGTARISNVSYFTPLVTYPTWEGAAAQYRKAAGTGRYVLLGGYGPLEALWRHHGYVQTMMDFAENQELLIEMANAHTDLTCAVIRRGVEEGITPDGLFLAEDLGTTHAPIMSPEAFRRVLKPCYVKIFDLCRELKLSRFMHSDGRIHEILDDLVEAGLQVFNPVDTASGMDPVDLKRRYGKELALYGGISARDMHDVEKSNAEIDRCVPVVAKGGGFIYHSDHSVPPSVGLVRFQEILRRVRELSDKRALAG